jgi:uncharacterized repeat protein (TIGR01451 family)
VETSQDIDAAANGFSISLWFNHSIENYCGVLLGGVEDNRVYIAVCQGNRLHYWLGEGGTSWNIIEAQEGSATVQSNAWHHLVYAGDDSYVRAYVDGVLDFSGPNTGSAAFSTPLDIGTFFPSLPYEGEFYKGIIDDVLVYDRALSEAEIQALYQWQGESDAPWLSVEPISGTVGAYGSQVLSVTFDATGLQPGDYTTELVLLSNDPLTPLVSLPVTMTVQPVLPMLEVAKYASASSVQAGEQLTYTIRITNTGNVDLHATVTDVLPGHVTSSGPLVWTPTIAAPGGVWTQAVVVTVEAGYSGPLINTVQVTSEEGATGSAQATCTSIRHYDVYLPVVMRQWP